MNESTQKLMFSSDTDLWATPQGVFDLLNAEFKFDMDVCATPENAKCSVYFTKEQDGLMQDWTGSVWMNPPYGRGIGAWVQKARLSSVFNPHTTVVCLLPARTDTKWWHQHVWAGRAPRTDVEVRFLQGRVKFGDAKAGAPFPSVVVIFRSPDAANDDPSTPEVA